MIIDKTNYIRIIYADNKDMLSHPSAFAQPYCRTGHLTNALKTARDIAMESESEGFCVRVDVCDLKTGVWSKHSLFTYKNGKVVKSKLLL